MFGAIVRIFLASFFWIAPISAASADRIIEWSTKTPLRGKLPLANACYENARDVRENHEALEPCNRSLESESLTQRRRAGVHANRGVIYYNIGEYALAVEDFTTSLELNINVIAKVRTNRGLAFEALGYESMARADYAAALAHNPDYALANERLQELRKPIYERSKQPRKITVEASEASMNGI